jgi:hypothetical protein
MMSRSAIVLLTAVGCLLTATAIAPSAQGSGALAAQIDTPSAAADVQGPPADLDPLSSPPLRPRSPRDPVPPGLLKHVTDDGSVLLTHAYSDPAPKAGDTSGYPVLRTSTPHMECAGGTYKPGIFLVYAYAKDVTPALTRDQATFEARRMFTSMADAYGHNVFLRFKDRLGGSAMMKWRVRCNSSGIAVGYYRLTTASNATPQKDLFGKVISDLKTAGLTNPDSKYMILYQDNRGCRPGQGQIEWDDARINNNKHNGQYGVGAMYAINFGCYGKTASYGAYITAHELLHNMGAVQKTAPHTTGGWHCRDALDVMCYDDDGTGPVTTYAACNRAWGGVDDLDCWEDDYFAWRTTGGDYPRNHWNTGDCRNRFISFYDKLNVCVKVYNSNPGFYQR